MSETPATEPNLSTRLNFKRLSEAKAPGFKLLADQVVIAKLVNCEIKERNPGKPMMNWHFKILPGDNVQFSDGETVTSEQNLWHSYSAKATDKYDPDSRTREVVEAMRPDLVDAENVSLGDVINSFVKLVIGTEQERTDPVTKKVYGARNIVKSFVPCTKEELEALTS